MKNSISSSYNRRKGKVLSNGFFLLILTLASIAAYAQEGFINPNIDFTVNDMALQPNGKIIIGGDFNNVGGVPRSKAARLNPNGSLDASFSDPNITGDIFNLHVYAVAVENDGKVIVGGLFTTVGGVARPYLARLNADGTVDSSFAPNVGSTVTAIKLQTDGKILIGGYFTTVGGQTRNRLARLNSDGSIDGTFQNPNLSDFPGTIAVQADGKILIGGYFTTVGGQPRFGSARLNSDGTLDSAFAPNIGGPVTKYVFQPDGKIIVGGFFQNVAGQTRTSVARLNSDGTLDQSFQNPGIGSGNVTDLDLQTNGKIVIGGEFSVIAGQERNDVARLNADGSFDPTFLDPNPNFGGTFFSINDVIVQPDGKILIGGQFNSVGGQPRKMVVRLLENGALDLPPAQIFAVTKTADTNDGTCNSDCSLREAVNAANSNPDPSQITFDNQIFGTAQMIVLSTGELVLEENRRITVTGPGANLLTVSGNNMSRIWRLRRDAAATITGLTMTGGTGAGGSGNANGGAIYIEPNGAATKLNLNSVVISGNQTGTGGGIGTLGSSTLTITNSVISNNTATSSPGGGGIYFDSGTLSIDNCTINNNAAAFELAGGGGGISFNGSFGVMTISNSTITGNTATYTGGISAGGTTNIINTTISNNHAVRSAGGIGASGNLTISGTIIRENEVTAPDGFGGGIMNFGRLLIINSEVRLNTGDFGGAIYTAGGLTVRDSEISQNSSRKSGGGIYNNAGGTFNLPVIIERSVISDNSAQNAGGGIYNRDTFNLIDSTVKGNHSTTAGGGIFNVFLNVGAAAFNASGATISGNSSQANGGGIANQQGTVKLLNSTVSGNNSRGFGSGIDNYVSGTLNLSNATIAFNAAFAAAGAGINNSSNSTVNSINSIVARNTGNNSTQFADFAGTLNSQGYNLIGTTAGTTITGTTTGNLLNLDPRLTSLSDNGGLTLTHALRTNSPAIDGGGVSEATIDQRGNQRPFDFSSIPNAFNGNDIGAFEKQANDVTSNNTLFDFDGDGKADVSVFRPDSGAWYLDQSQNGFAGLTFGQATDKIVPADYDGDGKTDVAVYRDGIWYLQRSQFGFTGIGFGAATDIPVPADFDGDGRAELAVFRESNGGWYIYNLTTNQSSSFAFGQIGDKPVPADYDGDQKADIAVYRNGTWYIQRSILGFTGIGFGQAGDKAVPADYDGDGKTDVAVFRNGIWYLLQSHLGFAASEFGQAGDVPVPADYDGDGKADLAVFRSGTWYLQQSTAGFTGVSFGAATDKPIPSAYVP